MSGSSLRTLEQVRMYSVPISDPRVSELITWYQGTLQRAIDVIWDNIEWKYRFPKVEKGGQVIAPSKFKAPYLPKDSPLRGGSATTSFRTARTPPTG